MERLLLHQVLSALAKPATSFEPTKVCDLIDRLLSVAKGPVPLGQVLWYSCRQPHTQQVAISLLNRLLDCRDQENLCSVVNYAHSAECVTPLHLAAGNAHCELVDSLLQLGADVWRASTHGQVAIHLAIKHFKTTVASARALQVVRLLSHQMTKTGPHEDKSAVVELFRKFAILPCAIEANNCAILQIITEQCRVRFDYRMYYEYLEYALQLMSSVEVIDYLIDQLAKCSTNADPTLSPVDLSLQYNNLSAMLKCIQLGFHCTSNILDNGAILLRRTLISERQREQFPLANKCFQYLMQQVFQSAADLSSPVALRRVHSLLYHRFSFKVCHRLNEPEVVIKGNYLTYALLNHCGAMGLCFARMPLPVQFSVENHLLRYYRFSRHDEPLMKLLIDQNRLHFSYGQNKLVQHFQQNSSPLYDVTISDSSLEEGDAIANDEYAQDKARFQQFLKWLDHHLSEPKPLTTLARNVILNRYWSCACHEECPNCQSSLRNMSIIMGKIHYVQQYLGKSLFQSTFGCTRTALC